MATNSDLGRHRPTSETPGKRFRNNDLWGYQTVRFRNPASAPNPNLRSPREQPREACRAQEFDPMAVIRADGLSGPAKRGSHGRRLCSSSQIRMRFLVPTTLSSLWARRLQWRGAGEKKTRALSSPYLKYEAVRREAETWGVSVLVVHPHKRGSPEPDGDLPSGSFRPVGHQNLIRISAASSTLCRGDRRSVTRCLGGRRSSHPLARRQRAFLAGNGRPHVDPRCWEYRAVRLRLFLSYGQALSAASDKHHWRTARVQSLQQTLVALDLLGPCT